MLYQYLSFLRFLGSQLLMSKGSNCTCLDGWVPWLAWIAVKHASSSPIGCRKLCISVLILLWALCFNWSYDYDVAYSDTSDDFGTNLEEGVFILMCVLCTIDYVFLLVNPILLIDLKWNKSWQYWSGLLPQMLHSPSALDVSSADG